MTHDLRIFTLTRTTPQVDTDRADDWRELASCREVDPEMFFPTQSEGEWDEPRRVCNRCPVKAKCLTVALQANEREGMWGGLTPGERQAEKAKGPHGTTKGYYQHKRRGEGACEECKEALRLYTREVRAARKREQA